MTVVTSTAPGTALSIPEARNRTGVLPALVVRRLALTASSPRAMAVPLLAPVLFALVVSPALANSFAAPGHRTTYMTFFALSTAGLLIPLNCMFSGLGVLVDRQTGAMRELLVAPINRSLIVIGNALAVLTVTALQVAVLVLVSALRGADYSTTARTWWFLGAAVLFTIFVYGLAEVLATRVTSPVEYTGALPAIAVVPYFFAGTLYPITSLPPWLEWVARVLPLTHAVALFRYGLTSGGPTALHNIWGMSSSTGMAALSLTVVAAYAVVTTAAAIRLFTKTAVS